MKRLINDNTNAACLYSVMMYYASYKDGYRVNNRVWNKGDIGKSISQLSACTPLSEMQVRRAMSFLIKYRYITVVDSGSWGKIYHINAL